MALTDEQLQANLDAAQAALHSLLTGSQTARLEYDGKQVVYTPATAGNLRAYIEELEIRLKVKKRRSMFSEVYF